MYDRYRDATWAQVSVGVDPDPTNNAQIIAWTRDYWEALYSYTLESPQVIWASRASEGSGAHNGRVWRE